MNRESFVIYTDGASRGNPGDASLGVYIETLDKGYGEVIGKATNNEAEYRALVFGLKKIKSLIGKAKAKEAQIDCRLDSELVVKQLNHVYKIEHETTQKYFIQVWNLMLDFKKVVFSHVPREQNKEADRLANEALDQARTQGKLL